MASPRRAFGYSTPENLDESNNEYSQSTWNLSGSTFATPTQRIPDWQLNTVPPSPFATLGPWPHPMPEYPPIEPQSRIVDYRAMPTRSDLHPPRETPGNASAHGRHEEYGIVAIQAQRPQFDGCRPMRPTSETRSHEAQGHTICMTAEPNTKSPQTKEKSRTARFQCDWPGCQYSGSFGRNTELQRHIKTLHVLPGSFKCPVSGCCVSCNREDNLKSHQRNVHGWKV
ncbi:hypothetical protein N7493_005870 [Penicillium malachiteum]|uniref:C2H2-type domain-containing protein n=1 Tax=Penicillium malachiteum TaxID=1324776 RepID=A0AAD6HL72_9EURO|nr:hypothetical protein N7493_005870 [Penicillium malachiteum]